MIIIVETKQIKRKIIIILNDFNKIALAVVMNQKLFIKS